MLSSTSIDLILTYGGELGMNFSYAFDAMHFYVDFLQRKHIQVKPGSCHDAFLMHANLK